MLSAARFCESRMRETLTSGSTRGEAIVRCIVPPLLYLEPAAGDDALKAKSALRSGKTAFGDDDGSSRPSQCSLLYSSHWANVQF